MPQKFRIKFTVTNQLSFDQRMHRICTSLSSVYDVELIGRDIDNSKLLDRPYIQTRLKCIFNSGKLFYLEINLRFLIYLLFSKVDVICAVDTDTLLGCFVAAKLKGIKIVYDAHEYYSEVIELANRPLSKSIWKSIENTFIPRVDAAYTVSANLQKIMSAKFGIQFGLIRNMSMLRKKQITLNQEKYLIYAGAVNEGRGLKEIIEAMPKIPMPLYICGTGDLVEDLKSLVTQLGLENKVFFKGNVPPTELNTYIHQAYLGFLLLENKGLSYYYSLANKFFDYIHGEIPQITINFPEYQTLTKDYKVALLIDLDVSQIIATVNKLIVDKELYNNMVEQCKIAKYDYCWQSEQEKLRLIYQQIVK